MIPGAPPIERLNTEHELIVDVFEIRGLPPAERLAARRRRTRPLVRALRRQLMRQGNGLSRHADIAHAFAYGTKRWRAFNRFL
ncbi:hypothetical protein D3227_38320 [Mesorhizobium waimense]|uniref:Transposase IS66 central domain-containing protein n=1 Tax=Mesorhizobium waimense TaxID=1300307 RepID=A0A3A5JUR9_9HYPH|nr:hypothetical protein D3227_38320 [Mesorhizobium waimense]